MIALMWSFLREISMLSCFLEVRNEWDERSRLDLRVAAVLWDLELIKYL